MSERTSSFSGYFAAALLFAVLLTIWRVYVLAGVPFDLYADEAQYWTWAQSFELGYYSKPPIVAWAIMATTSWCGDGEGCIRLASPLAWLAASLVMYALGRELYDRYVGLLASVVFNTLPAVTLSAALISTDPFLLLFWTLALYAFVRTLHTDRWRWALATGLFCGLGMLSKYNFALFLPSALLYLWWTPRFRSFLTSPKLYTAIAIATVIFLPNVWWNAEHGFVSFLHTRDNADLENESFRPDKLLEFVGAQFLVFGPLLFGALLYFLARIRNYASDERQRLLYAMILPMLAVIVTLSFLSRAHANWAAAIYVPATLLVVAGLVHHAREWLLHVSIVLHLLIAGAFYNFHDMADLAGVELTYDQDPHRRVLGWHELGDAVTELRAEYPHLMLLTDSRKVTAWLLYYVEPKPIPLIKWDENGQIQDHYELTTSMEGHEGEDFLFITRDETPDKILARFREAKKIRTIEIPIHDYTRRFDVYSLTDFQGYAPRRK